MTEKDLGYGIDISDLQHIKFVENGFYGSNFLFDFNTTWGFFRGSWTFLVHNSKKIHYSPLKNPHIIASIYFMRQAQWRKLIFFQKWNFEKINDEFTFLSLCVLTFQWCVLLEFGSKFMDKERMIKIPRCQPIVIDSVSEELLAQYDPSKVGMVTSRFKSSKFTTLDHERIESMLKIFWLTACSVCVYEPNNRKYLSK